MKRIAVITPPFTYSKKGVLINDYFTTLTSHLIQSIQKKYPECDVIVKIPTSDSTAYSEQLEYVEKLGNRPEIDYIVMMPSNIQALCKIEMFKKYFAKLISDRRIIFLDQGFQYEDDFKNICFTAKQGLVPYVQANWIQGGSIAAKSAIEYFEKNKIWCPHIVILNGSVGAFQGIQGFTTEMNNYAERKANEFFPTYFKLDCDYTKGKAKELFGNYLASAITSHTPIDLIFSTNDEMGLGVREALIDKRKEYIEALNLSENIRLPKIIGFDGINDFTFLIDTIPDDFIYDTVYVDISKQVTELIKIIEGHNKEKQLSSPSQYMKQIDCNSFHDKLPKK